MTSHHRYDSCAIPVPAAGRSPRRVVTADCAPDRTSHYDGGDRTVTVQSSNCSSRRAPMARDLTYKLYIDGAWVDSFGDETVDVLNPATEEVIGTVPQASREDVRRAITAARRAFDEGPWPRM